MDANFKTAIREKKGHANRKAEDKTVGMTVRA
jgi:hypothetical protein